MNYNGNIYRPPIEAHTMLIPITEGCTHNRCTFCNMYQNVPFRMWSLDEVENYVGFPVWWFNAPMPIGSFFEEYDVSGKTIVPFCTNQGSGVDSGYELLKDECDGATVAEGFNGNNTDLNEVTNWLKSQGYIND